MMTVPSESPRASAPSVLHTVLGLFAVASSGQIKRGVTGRHKRRRVTQTIVQKEFLIKVTSVLIAGCLLLATALPAVKAVAQQNATVTDDNLNEMIKSAKTPADHEAIAAYYDAEAAENEKTLAFTQLT
jgi:hypothetical protein